MKYLTGALTAAVISFAILVIVAEHTGIHGTLSDWVALPVYYCTILIGAIAIFVAFTILTAWITLAILKLRGVETE